MNIVLIGYRASGKSTIGHFLADQLSLKFVDIDLDIMARYDHKSVVEIWTEFGEPAYRETECDVTEEACARDSQVIALGGGTPMQPRAFASLVSAKNATHFFLEAPAEVLYERSQTDTDNANNRPSFSSCRGGLEEVRHMLVRREPVYRQLANFTIDVAHQSLADAAQEIVQIVARSTNPTQ
jgi:shikimate kinase